MKYKIVLAYDGTHYAGWQIQKNAPSIQASVEHVLLQLTQQHTPITGSGRTDAGVHAKGQVAHFVTEKALSLKSLNSLLPPDIRILSLEPAEETFHARFSVKEKIYLYHISRESILSPFLRRYSLHYTFPLDKNRLLEAIPYFIGTKDFSSFANELLPYKNPIKTLLELSYIETPHGFTLKFRGDGFLYKMVRNITGTLLAIGRNKLSKEEIPLIFAKKSRSSASAPAPPHALFLESVLY